jgi:hypothetical protein
MRPYHGDGDHGSVIFRQPVDGLFFMRKNILFPDTATKPGKVKQQKLSHNHSIRRDTDFPAFLFILPLLNEQKENGELRL